MSALRWITAIGASVVLHGAGLAALAFSTDPQDAPDQSVPKSRFTVEAADVARSTAAATTPEADALAETSAQTTAVAAGTIARSRAAAAALDPERLSSAQPDTRLAATAPQATASRLQSLQTPVTATATPIEADRLQATTPAAAVQPAALPATPQATLVVAAARPVTVQTNAAAPLLAVAVNSAPAQPVNGAAPVAALTQASATVPTLETPAAPATSLTLPAQAGTATLAWSGGQDTAVSAASLAAITAFTQQGDLAAASAEVRDGIAGILAAVPCSRLQTTFLPETGALELRGHIPEDALRGPVLAALRAQVGDAIPLSDQILILPRPQCGALAGIADIGLPQSTEQLTNPAVIGEDGFARSFAYADGDRLSLDLTAPDYDAYVYVDYFAADGTVIHLQPNEVVPLEFASAKSELSVGRARSDGAPSLELTVSAPYGQEIAAAFAASVPLYDGTRPIVEQAAPYLTFLKERVTAARAAHADFKGEWVYFFITTSAE